MPNYIKLILSILLAQSAGFIGAIFTSSSVQGWYSTIIKPELSPPNWIFGPVWTTLYFLMGISAYLIWKKGIEKREVKIAIGIYAFQLVLNSIWSILFFGLENPGLAFIEIIFLWLSILATIISFYKINKLSSYLLFPYILWVSFAMYLNYSIWILN